jgi:hypothetical protein
MTTELMASIIKSHPDEDARMDLFEFWCEHEGLEDNPEALDHFVKACGLALDPLDKYMKDKGLVVMDEFANFPRLAK